MTPRRRAGLALGALAALHAAALLAGFLAPYDYAEQRREYSYAPPTRPRFVDAAGRFHWRPFVYGLAPDGAGGYRSDTSRIYPLRLRLPHKLFGVDAPGAVFLLGADAYGRDLFSRLLHGGRISLFTGLAAALLSLALGLTFGTTAGYFGGWTDRLLMRGGELVMALPWLYLLLAVRAFLPLRISGAGAFALVTLIIGCAGWARPARLVRGVVLSARERGFALAARGFGASHGYVIRRHILPLTMSAALTQAAVLIPQFVLAEMALSFLGLGVGEPVPTWGNMLAEARQYHALVSQPWMLAPGLALAPVLLAYLALADALAERAKD